MSDDHLVRRLRATTQHLASSTYVDLSMWQSHSSACFEAADAIERLAADNAILSKWHIDAEDRAEAAERKVEKLREALRPFVDAYNNTIAGEDDKWLDTDSLWESAAAMALEAGDLRRARAALDETEKADG